METENLLPCVPPVEGVGTEIKMKKYYTAGELAAMARVSPRTIRFYDQKNLLTPVGYSEGKYRLYDKNSLIQLQEIVMLKYLGLSLEEISTIMKKEKDIPVRELLWEQKKLLLQKQEQLNQVIRTLDEVAGNCEERDIELSELSGLIKLVTGNSKAQRSYDVWECFGIRQRDWYPWLFRQLRLQEGESVLDIGAGGGLIWQQSWDKIPANVRIHMVDKFEGGLGYMQSFERQNRGLLEKSVKCSYQQMDANLADFGEGIYDCVIALHMWYYIDDPQAFLGRVKKALKKNGRLCTNFNCQDLVPDLDKLLKGFSQDFSMEAIMERQRKRSMQVELDLKETCSSLTYQIYENELHIDDLDQLYRFLVEKDLMLGEKIQKVGSDFMRYLSDYLRTEGKVVVHSHAKMFTGYF